MTFNKFNRQFVTSDSKIHMKIPGDMIFEENGDIYVIKGTKSSEKSAQGTQSMYYKGLRLVDGFIYNLKVKAIENHNITDFEIRSAKNSEYQISKGLVGK